MMLPEVRRNVDSIRLEGLVEAVEEDTSSVANHDIGIPVRPQLSNSLAGVKVVIIHIKEKLNDGVQVADTILRELQEHEDEARLGCEFIISQSGQAVYL